MKSQCDIVIIGAGIIGLATALKLKKQHPNWSFEILEKEVGVGKHQTGHNSGVIHSGIYYRPGSLKASTCIKGASQMVAFCQEHHIPTLQCGKVIVATEASELPKLVELHQRGIANGVLGLKIIHRQELQEIEPHINGIQALHSPQTTIVDFKAVAKAMHHLLEKQDVAFHFNEPCLSIVQKHDRLIIKTQHREIETPYLINCCGAWSDDVFKMIDASQNERIIPFRGEYYVLASQKAHQVNGLVYPVPDPALPFLGVHLTRMIDGDVEAGPNAVLALAKDAYTKTQINPRHCYELLKFPGFWKMTKRYWKVGTYELCRSYSKRMFLKSLQRFMPSLEMNDLMPGGAGIRAQLVKADGSLCDDFCVKQFPRMLHVLNAPSPAATASLAIADHLVSLAKDWA